MPFPNQSTAMVPVVGKSFHSGSDLFGRVERKQSPSGPPKDERRIVVVTEIVLLSFRIVIRWVLVEAAATAAVP